MVTPEGPVLPDWQKKRKAYKKVDKETAAKQVHSWWRREETFYFAVVPSNTDEIQSTL